MHRLINTSTNDQELAYAAAQGCGSKRSCSLARWQHFSAWNNVMADILKVPCQIGTPTPSIDAYLLILLEEQFRQISADPIWYDGALSLVHTGDYSRRPVFGDYSRLSGRGLRLFWRGRLNKKKNKMSSDICGQFLIFKKSFVECRRKQK